MSLTVLIAVWLEGHAGKQGALVRFSAKACIIILKFSLTESCSHLGKDHSNEIKHEIHPE